VDSRRRRLLICDDDDLAHQVVGMLAEGVGYDVVGNARTAIEAEELVDAFRAHVLVLDLALQGISGLDIIASVRTKFPDTAIIVYTAFDSIAEAADRAGAFAVVRKSEPGKLEDALQRATAAARGNWP
jgi:DNA-binding NarL/FixJ family response regulator